MLNRLMLLLLLLCPFVAKAQTATMDCSGSPFSLIDPTQSENTDDGHGSLVATIGCVTTGPSNTSAYYTTGWAYRGQSTLNNAITANVVKARITASAASDGYIFVLEIINPSGAMKRFEVMRASVNDAGRIEETWQLPGITFPAGSVVRVAAYGFGYNCPGGCIVFARWTLQ